MLPAFSTPDLQRNGRPINPNWWAWKKQDLKELVTLYKKIDLRPIVEHISKIQFDPELIFRLYIADARSIDEHDNAALR